MHAGDEQRRAGRDHGTYQVASAHGRRIVGRCQLGAQTFERLAYPGRVCRRPERWQRRAQVAAVAGGRHPGVEHRDHAAVVDASQQTPGALRQQQRRMAGGDGHEPVAAAGRHRALPCGQQRVVGPGERDAVDEHQRQRRAGHVDALPQRQRAEQRRLGVVGEPLHQRRGGVLALAQHRGVEPVPHDLGGGLGGAHRREQAQRSPARRGDQCGDLVELLGRAGAVAPRRRQMGGDVEDARLRVFERRTDVDAAPLDLVVTGQSPCRGHRIERAADGQRGRGEHGRRVLKQPAAQQPCHRQAAPPAARRGRSRGCPRGPATPHRCGRRWRGRTTSGCGSRCR